MFMLHVMYLILGSIFDTVAAMVITLPFVFPLVTSLGFDPITIVWLRWTLPRNERLAFRGHLLEQLSLSHCKGSLTIFVDSLFPSLPQRLIPITAVGHNADKLVG